MNKNTLGMVIGALFLLAGIAGYSVYQYIVSMQENAGLQTELEQVQKDIRQLELVRDNLNADLENTRASEKALVLENTGLKDQIKNDQTKFTMLETTIQEAQSNIDTLNAQISIARQENAALVGQLDGLKTKLTAVVQEKEQMSATLNSVDALKKAIKELKRKTRNAQRSVPITVVVDAKKQVKEMMIGNKGFIIRDGKVLTPAKVKIEVQAQASSEIN